MAGVPDPNALRRSRASDGGPGREWTRLTNPDPGIDPPEWPLATPTERQLALWRDLHTRPQSTAWTADDRYAAALMCQLIARAELPDSPVTLQAAIRLARDELGLSHNGRLRRRFLLPDEDAAAEPKLATVSAIAPDPERHIPWYQRDWARDAHT